MWSSTIEEKYDNLKYKYEKLQKEYADLRENYKKTDDELYHANFRIRHELEPRIISEQRSYDNYVLGGGNSCFAQGMNGGCGTQCPHFGQEDECSEIIYDISDEELLQYYIENEAIDSVPIVRETLIDRGLEEKVENIDNEYCRQCIEDLNKRIEGTKQTIELYQKVLEMGIKIKDLKSQFQGKNDLHKNEDHNVKCYY